MKGLTSITLSLSAMATRFELILYGSDAVRLRAAGEEALSEIERLDQQLSYYRADSEIRWINTYAAERPVKVEPRLFRMLRDCASLSRRTDGAFDVTVAPLMRAWRFINDLGRVPEPAELEAARTIVGMSQVKFDEDAFTVRLERRGVELDLGAYGKGYAIERAIGILRENGITSALLHGGTSSVYAIGSPPDSLTWRVSLREPLAEGTRPIIIGLVDNALSVSAVHGKSFVADGRMYGHVIDPRTGEPVAGTLAAAVIGPSPSVCEALSTALLILGQSWMPTLTKQFPGYEGLVAFEDQASGVKIAQSRDATA